jgi:predicted ribosome quality control (RQC) complex YloA/Tae2 family protein
MKEVTVTDFYSQEVMEITIPLKINVTPSKNAQIYYSKYNKAKNAEKIVSKQMEKNLEEIEYLESLLESMSKIETIDELKEIREELFQQGYIKRHKSQKNKKSKERSVPTKPKKFKSSDGYPILVGKNNKQNDFVTLKLSNSTDLWFHTKNIPGSHVVIKNDKSKKIPDTTLLEAAGIAAFFSKAKASSKVPVDYTEIKNVKKPSGAKPGMVIYDSYNTIYITPDEKIIKNLQKDE